MSKLCKCGVKLDTPSENYTGKCVFCQGPSDQAKARGLYMGMLNLIQAGQEDALKSVVTTVMKGH